MKIIKRGIKTSAKFKVVKNNFFLAGGHQPEVGEILEFIGRDSMSIALGLVQQGKLIPDDLPEMGRYICVSPFDMPGREKKFEAKAGEVVELRAKDALELMLKRKIVPKDKIQWSPFRIKEVKKKDIFEAPQFSNGKTRLGHDWIVRK